MVKQAYSRAPHQVPACPENVDRHRNRQEWIERLPVGQHHQPEPDHPNPALRTPAAKSKSVPARKFSNCRPLNHFSIAAYRMKMAASTIIAPSNPAEKNVMRS